MVCNFSSGYTPYVSSPLLQNKKTISGQKALFAKFERNRKKTMDVVLATPQVSTIVNSPEVRTAFQYDNPINICNSPFELQLYNKKFSIERLWKVIEESKSDPKVAKAAANAISVLNFKGFSFSGMDLRGIRVPGANLSYAIMHQTQLNFADLSETNLEGAFLGESDMRGGKLEKIRLSSILPIQASPSIEFLMANQQIIVTRNGHQYQMIDRYTLKSSEIKPCGTITHAVLARDLIISVEVNILKFYNISEQAWVWPSLPYLQSTDVILALSLSKDSLFLATATHLEILIWDLEKKSLICSVPFERHFSLCLSFTPDKCHLISPGSEDKITYIWDLNNPRHGRKIVETTDRIGYLAVCSNRIAILGGLDSHQLFILDIVEGKVIDQFTCNRSIASLVSLDEKHIAAAIGNSIEIWNIETKKREDTLTGHLTKILALHVDSDGNLISGDDSGIIQFWNISYRRQAPEFFTHSYEVSGLSVKGHALMSVDQTKIGRNDALTTLILSTTSCWKKTHSITLESCLFACYYGSDQILTFDKDCRVRIYDNNGRNIIETFRLECKDQTRVNCVSLSQNEKFFAAVIHDIIHVWDLEARCKIGEIQTHLRGMITSLQFSDDGIQIAAGTILGEIWIGNFIRLLGTKLEWKSKLKIITLSEPSKQSSLDLKRISFSPTGMMDYLSNSEKVTSSDSNFSNFLTKLGKLEESLSKELRDRLADSDEGTVDFTLFAPNGTPFAQIKGDYVKENNRINSVLFLDPVTLVTGGNSIRIWNIQEKRLMRTFSVPKNKEIFCLALSQDKQTLFSGGEEKVVQVWDMQTGHCIQTLRAHLGEISSLIVDQSDHLISAGKDGAVNMWAKNKDSIFLLQWTRGNGNSYEKLLLTQDCGLSEQYSRLFKQKGAIGLSSGDDIDHSLSTHLDRTYLQNLSINLKSRRKVFFEVIVDRSDESFSIAKGYLSLGDICMSAQNIEEAIECWEKARPIFEERREQIPMELAFLYLKLADGYSILKNSVACYRNFASAAHLIESVLGPSHLMLADTYRNWGKKCTEFRDQNRELPIYKKALDIYQSQDALNNPFAIEVAHYYGLLCKTRTRDYQTAIKYYTLALDAATQFDCEDHIMISTIKNNLGSALEANGDYSKALTNYADALQLRLTLYGENHRTVRNVRDCLGSLYSKMGERELAAMEYKKKGDSFYKSSDYVAAKDAYSQALEINRNSAVLYFNRGLCYKKISNFLLSKQDFECALRIDPNYKKAKQNLASLDDL